MNTVKVICKNGTTYKNFGRNFYGERCTWIRICDDLELNELKKAIEKYNYDAEIVKRFEFIQDDETTIIYTVSWPASYVPEGADDGLRGEPYIKWEKIKRELYKYRKYRLHVNYSIVEES